MNDGIIEVRSSTGDNRLGGEDFNEVLIKRFMAKHPGQKAEKFYQKVREQAERARRALSSQSSAAMRVVWNDQAHELTVSDDEFAKDSEELLDRLRAPVLRALRDSSLKVDSLAEIVLVGGATRMPLVRKAVTRMFGRFAANHVNPDEAV